MTPAFSSAATRRSSRRPTGCAACARLRRRVFSLFSALRVRENPHSCAPGFCRRLARDDAHFLPLPVIRPERAALFGENGLLGALETAPTVTDAGRIARGDLRRCAAACGRCSPNSPSAALRRTLAEDGSATPPAIVIAVDQAEELFRAEGARKAARCSRCSAISSPRTRPAIIALFAIRSDSYDALEHAKPLEGLAQSTLPLLPMPRGAYIDVIEGPARRLVEAGGRLAIEPRLTERLLGDIDKGGGKDALPLLAFTLGAALS